MAKSRAVWGIDIGNCSLKALRLRPSNEPNQVVADAFDYIEYPKILTQPGAEPGELVQEALRQFLSRNSVRGDGVAISVSGQSGLARFVKLPPVEAKKIPDIVRFEARQQIPFDLQDVVWDYQRMGGGAEEEGFVLETEIGLFAMKRDQVLRALEPFNAASIPVDFVQLTPLSLYNYVAFDFLRDLPPPDQYNPEEPPPSVVILSLGTDATDLVVTNGFRVWQRSIPLGGNHFTKALTKELKLTFAKAEHLKRNATAAEDPKAVFQAMRPVFNDLLTEVQRSIGYFTSIDRAAKIEQVIALGNAMKLPGLRRYLSQSLGFEVVRIDAFGRMTGAEVTGAPAFQENLLCFGVCYGLALQGLGLGSLRTNLLPKEIVRERLVRQKKPWAVAAAALLLASFAFSFGSYSAGLARLDKSIFGKAEDAAKQAVDTRNKFQSQAKTLTNEYNATDTIGEHLVSNVEGRILWLEVFKAINSCLPTDPEGQATEDLDDPKNIPLRNRVYIESVQCEYSGNLATWYQSHAPEDFYQPPPDKNAKPADDAAKAANPKAADAKAANLAKAAKAPGSLSAFAKGFAGSGKMGARQRMGGKGVAAPAAPLPTDPNAITRPGPGPTGPGWVFILRGHHYHNFNQPGKATEEGVYFVRKALLEALHSKKIELPTPDGQGMEEVSLQELGIGYPLTVGVNPINQVYEVNPFPELQSPVGAAPEGATATPPVAPPPQPVLPVAGSQATRMGQAAVGGVRGTVPANMIPLWRYDFEAQFCWQPTPPSKRHEKKEMEIPKATIPTLPPTSKAPKAPVALNK